MSQECIVLSVCTLILPLPDAAHCGFTISTSASHTDDRVNARNERKVQGSRHKQNVPAQFCHTVRCQQQHGTQT